MAGAKRRRRLGRALGWRFRFPSAASTRSSELGASRAGRLLVIPDPRPPVRRRWGTRIKGGPPLPSRSMHRRARTHETHRQPQTHPEHSQRRLHVASAPRQDAATVRLAALAGVVVEPKALVTDLSLAPLPRVARPASECLACCGNAKDRDVARLPDESRQSPPEPGPSCPNPLALLLDRAPPHSTRLVVTTFTFTTAVFIFRC
ncbi:hypothetical protein P171DRAFT_520954 [Karstenula rhodostoma CBS 690.94]|uniref:Uncharacterized protein n=1 Tax=Karstenula rhodostoma CBS 690.94 TaxID=1392251 RepID=A0A9P4UAT5_9PLEO|nr:hypothetical protein P171DRAFT_520954 [Karstenula rhodostoma CBS 690.94]